MKQILLCIALVSTNLLLAAQLYGSEIVGGPGGGRLIEIEIATVEFLVTESRHASVEFLSDDLTPTAAGDAVIRIIAELPEGRQEIEIERTPTGYITKSPLPAAEPYRILLQLRSAPGKKPHNIRIDLNTTVCSGCNRGEYTCTCGH